MVQCSITFHLAIVYDSPSRHRPLMYALQCARVVNLLLTENALYILHVWTILVYTFCVDGVIVLLSKVYVEINTVSLKHLPIYFTFVSCYLRFFDFGFQFFSLSYFRLKPRFSCDCIWISLNQRHLFRNTLRRFQQIVFHQINRQKIGNSFFNAGFVAIRELYKRNKKKRHLSTVSFRCEAFHGWRLSEPERYEIGCGVDDPRTRGPQAGAGTADPRQMRNEHWTDWHEDLPSKSLHKHHMVD